MPSKTACAVSGLGAGARAETSCEWESRRLRLRERGLAPRALPLGGRKRLRNRWRVLRGATRVVMAAVPDLCGCLTVTLSGGG